MQQEDRVDDRAQQAHLRNSGDRSQQTKRDGEREEAARRFDGCKEFLIYLLPQPL